MNKVKKYLFYSFILILPFLGMIIINESVRFNAIKSINEKHIATTINSQSKLNNKCTWACHNNTSHCKINHAKIAQKHFDKIDSVYFGVIDVLKASKNYKLANVILFVIAIPLILFILLIKSINIQFQINQKKKHHKL